MKKRGLLSTVLLVSLTGCLSTYDEEQGAVSYAQVPSPREPGGVHPLTLDIQMPEGPGPFPAIVFIHGGGWVAGNLHSAHLLERIAEASRRGFVALSIAYRRADHDDGSGRALHPWPAQMQDVRCALRWLSTHASEYKVDPSRVGVWGNSAGGHLALLATYARDERRFDPEVCPWTGDIALKAVVLTAPVSDPAAVYETTEWWLKAYTTRWLDLPDGANVRDEPAAFADVTPLRYVASGPKVPTLIFQGTEDTVVPPVTQQTFVSSARTLGQDIQIEWLEGSVHDVDATYRKHIDERTFEWFGERL